MAGSAFYFAGFVFIVMGWFLFTTIGFVMQIYGLLLLFRSFIRTVFSYMQTLPFVGPCVRNTPWVHRMVDYLADGGKSGPSGSKSKRGFGDSD